MRHKLPVIVTGYFLFRMENYIQKFIKVIRVRCFFNILSIRYLFWQWATMTFRGFPLNNVMRNICLYVAYFLSSMFTVIVFLTFANFAFHPVLSVNDLNGHAQKGMAVAGGIIYVFSFFFILYSMSSFLQSRKKEFGSLMIQGMSNRQIRWMVFLENMLIG